MDKNKPQMILLDRNGLDSVAKALSSGCWTLSDSGQLEIAEAVEDASTSVTHGGAPQVTLAQGNVRPVTQVSATGGPANSAAASQTSEQAKVTQRSMHLTTITEMGKKLGKAAKSGDLNLVRTLLAHGAPFISDGPIGMTPLHFAAQNGHTEICERLVCAGLNIDARNKIEKTALHLAAMEGHTSIVYLLVSSQASLNACDMLKMTPLHWACNRGHVGAARVLLKNSAKTNLMNKFFKTPLHLAVENGHKQIISLLQGDLSYDEGGEEAIAVESISLDDMIHDPIACKTEEIVCTEGSHDHYEEEEISVNHSVKKEVVMEEEEGEETASNFDGDFRHTIITDDDTNDQNTSVLATLAELAEATSKNGGGGGGGCIEDMSSIAALELLKAQAALMPIDDTSALVTSAVAHGQTLQLTEAGRQALKLMKQEPLLLPTSPMSQNNMEEMDTHTCTVSSSDSSEVQCQSDSVDSCLPALLSTTDDKEEEIVEQSREEEVMQVITLSPEQYAALTGGKNGPIILKVMNDSPEVINDLDTGQPLAKRQKIMQLVTKSGRMASSQGQAIARVTGEVLSVDLSNTNVL